MVYKLVNIEPINYYTRHILLCFIFPGMIFFFGSSLMIYISLSFSLEDFYC